MDAGEDVGDSPALYRPAPLLEVLPQEQVQQRTSEQIVDPVPLVPLLHDAVPQMVEQLVDFLTPLDFPVPEQVIEVPKIVCPPHAAGTVFGVPQTVEQLVEAPTIVSLIEVIRQPVEQPVDIPVRAWGGTGGRLQGFLPGQYSSSSVEQIADIPVPHGGLHLQDPGLASLPHEVLLGKRFKGFLALFPGGKKCEHWSALGVGTAPRVEPIHAGSSFRPVLGG